MARRARKRGFLTLAVVVVAWCAAAAPAEAKRAGTHFLAELDAGACLSGDGGPQASLSLGVGGKFKGFAPRLYLLGSLARSEYADSDAAPVHGDGGVESGSFGDLALGPRVYVPIIGPLRWFADGLIGASYARATFISDELGLGPLSADEWLALAIVSSGVQVRLIRALAVGARVGFAVNEAGLTGASRLAGVHDPVRVSVDLGVTWHF